MGLNSGTVIIPSKGTVFFGPPNAVPLTKSTLDPADAATYVGWDNIGHTSRENTVAVTKSGGDATNKGSWWDASLVSNRDPVSWAITINALQVDAATLLLAFPTGRITTAGRFVVPSDGGSTERALLVLCVDGEKRLVFGGPRVSLALGDAPSISTDGFFEIQLSGAMLSATVADGSGEVLVGDLLYFDPVLALSVPAPRLLSALPSGRSVGQTVTINGSYLSAATGVTMGGTAMTSVTVISPTQLTAVVPAGSAGSAVIVVTTPAGVSNSLAYTRGA